MTPHRRLFSQDQNELSCFHANVIIYSVIHILLVFVYILLYYCANISFSLLLVVHQISLMLLFVFTELYIIDVLLGQL